MRPAGLGIRQVFLKSCAEMHLWGAALEGEDPNVFDAACITQTMGETTSHYAWRCLYYSDYGRNDISLCLTLLVLLRLWEKRHLIMLDVACITQTMGETTSHYAFQSEAIQYLVMTPYYNI